MTDDEDGAGHCTSFKRVSNTTQDRQRGQITGRLVLGVFVALVLAAPLATIAVDIQSSLAATSAFSWVTAGIIALLTVGAMAAKALGLE